MKKHPNLLRDSLWPLWLVALFFGIAATPAWAQSSGKLQELGRWGGPVNATFVANGVVFIGEGNKIVALDPAQSNKPLSYLVLESISPVLQIEYAYNLLYIVQEDRLSVVDGRNPTRMSLVTQITTAPIHSIQISEPILYLLYVSGNIASYTLFFNQGNPLLQGTLANVDTKNIWFFRVRGNRMYLGRSDRVDIYDVSNILSVPLIGTLPHSVNSRDIAFDPGSPSAAVIGGGQISAWNISDPANPQFIASSPAPDATRITFGNGAWFINAPGQLVQEWLLDGGQWFLHTQIDGGLLAPDIRTYHHDSGRIYAAAGREGLRVVDVTQLNAIHVATAFNMPDNPSDAVLEGDRLYVTDNNEGLFVLDFIDPAHPAWLGEYSSQVQFNALDVKIPIVTVASQEGLRTFDAADPQNIQLLDQYSVESFSNVAVRGNFAYATETAFRVLDISDPGNITEGNIYIWDSNPEQVELVDDYAYVRAKQFHSLYVLDISSPTVILEITTIPATNTSLDFSINGSKMYFIDRLFKPGSKLFDISNPDAPAVIEDLSYDPLMATLVGPYLASFTFYDVFLTDLRFGGDSPTVDQSEIGPIARSFKLSRMTTIGDNIIGLCWNHGLWLYTTDAWTFNFDREPDMWPWQTGDAAPALTAPTFSHASGALQITATDNVLNFGWWQSPGGVIPVVPDHLIRLNWFVRSDQSDPTLVPTFRMRAMRENIQQSDVLTINATGPAELVPIPGARFTQIIDPLPGVTGPEANHMILAFDLAGFDPARAPDATLLLDDLIVDTSPRSALPVPQLIAEWGFESDAEGWQFVQALPFPPAANAWHNGALRLQSSEFLSFGSWVSPAGAAGLNPGDLVRARFRLATDAADLATVPTFRVRLISEDLQFALEKGINSVGDGALGPAPQGRDFDIYAIVPGFPNSGPLTPVQLGFDLVHFDPADQTWAAIDLLSARLDRYQPIPLLQPEDDGGLPTKH